MNDFLQSVAIAGIAICIGFAIINLLLFIGDFLQRGQRHISMIPLIGGVCGFIGFALIPSLRFYAWIPLVIDVGTLSFIIALPNIAREIWETSSFNLISEYVAYSGSRNMTIRLFKNSVFTLKYKVNRASEESGITQLGGVGNWSETESRLSLELWKRHIEFEKISYYGTEEIRIISGADVLQNIEKDQEFSFAFQKTKA